MVPGTAVRLPRGALPGGKVEVCSNISRNRRALRSIFSKMERGDTEAAAWLLCCDKDVLEEEADEDSKERGEDCHDGADKEGEAKETSNHRGGAAALLLLVVGEAMPPLRLALEMGDESRRRELTDKVVSSVSSNSCWRNSRKSFCSLRISCKLSSKACMTKESSMPPLPCSCWKAAEEAVVEGDETMGLPAPPNHVGVAHKSSLDGKKDEVGALVEGGVVVVVVGVACSPRWEA